MGQQPKEIRGRIRSVTSTKKITRTMELVATSKMKRAQEAVSGATPYQAKLREVLGEVVARSGELGHPLLRERRQVKRVQVLLVNANRGLCGGYNANVIRLAKKVIEEQRDKGREVLLDVVGKKAVGTLTYQGYAIQRRCTDLSDRPGFDDARRLIAPLREDFLSGKVDEVYVVWTRWKSLASQIPTVMRLLPIERPDGGAARGGDMIFSPKPEQLLGRLLPMYLVQSMYTFLVEANAGEQVARRTAMKSATDNASEMITGLTRTLNRARQAQITQEIAELVGGAEALKK